jgi:hypothetical protein
MLESRNRYRLACMIENTLESRNRYRLACMIENTLEIRIRYRIACMIGNRHACQKIKSVVERDARV